MTTSAIVIQARGINHNFGKGDAKTQVLFDINLDIRAGELVLLRGASGSGKTTLLTLLACLRNLQQGNATVLGTTLFEAPEKHLNAVRRRLGFIFQAHNLHESLSAMQNVRMGLELHGRNTMRQWQTAASHILIQLGLEDRLNYKPGNLSGGQKQRVAVARALVGNPDIVFADEPTAALDAESGTHVVKLLKALGEQRGTATLMVSHDHRIIEFADRVLTMENGRIVAQDTRAEFLNRDQGTGRLYADRLDE